MEWTPVTSERVTKCKPCITIRTICKLLWKNYIVESTKNFKSDYRSYSMVNAAACELDFHHDPVNLLGKAEFQSIKDIRAVASNNFQKVDKDYIYKNWDARLYNLLFPEKKDE